MQPAQTLGGEHDTINVVLLCVSQDFFVGYTFQDCCLYLNAIGVTHLNTIYQARTTGFLFKITLNCVSPNSIKAKGSHSEWYINWG